MTQENFTKTATRELDSLNKLIDTKIIRGLSYKAEAKRHKFLISKIGNTTRVQSFLFGKQPGFVSSFFL
ncbi:MAG: hypothetical protein M3Q24_00885 [bacterium]|nr:hypothetical protein [bacterium]